MVIDLVTLLAGKGLNLLAKVIEKKGKDFVEEKTGVTLSGTELTPDQLTALKQYELEHEEELQKIALEAERARLQDTADARQRDVEVQREAQASFWSKNTPHLMALGTVALTFILFFMVLFRQINAVNKDIIIYLLGILSAITTQIFAFYFGSSSGSKDKDEALKHLAGGKAGGGS